MSFFTPKTDLKRKQNCYIPDEKSDGLGIQRESCKEKWPIFFFFPTILG